MRAARCRRHHRAVEAPLRVEVSRAAKGSPNPLRSPLWQHHPELCYFLEGPGAASGTSPPPLSIFLYVTDWELGYSAHIIWLMSHSVGCRHERRGTTFTRAIPPSCPKTQRAGGSIPFTRHPRRPSGSCGALRTDGSSLRGTTQARCGSRYGQKLGRRSTRALSQGCGRLSRREHLVS